MPSFKDHTPYQLRPEVSCDWLRFHHLARRGLARGGAPGAADLDAALQHVRGEPFTVTVRGRYAWAEPLRQEAISEIIDAAETLARHHLDEGDWNRTKAAAESGLIGVPGAEQLHRLRFAALAELDDMEGLKAAIKQLDTYNETSGVETETETIDLIDRLLRRGGPKPR